MSGAKVRISLACIACKKRKAKCSGGPPPCQSCKQSGTICIIDESLDGRRKAAAKRTFDELTYHKTFIESLLTYIRTFDSTSLDQLVDLIKADVPMQEIGAMIDESLRLSKQGAQTEESLKVLRIDSGSSTSRNIRRKIEKETVGESPSTPSASENSQRTPFETQAQRINEQETLLTFLKNTSFDEVEDIVRFLQKSAAPNLYDGLMAFITDLDKRGITADSAAGSSTSATQRPTSSVPSREREFSRARTLSLPNLFQYQQYLQGLFAEYASTDLKAEATPDSQERKEWHPALKLRFSSSSADSDESSGGGQGEGSVSGDTVSNLPHTNLMSEAAEKGKARADDTNFVKFPKQNPDRLRLRIDNDPLMGEDFQLSPHIPHASGGIESALETPSGEIAVGSTSMAQRMSSLNIPLYQLLPLTGIDDSPLARSYTSYRDEARSMIANGVPIRHVFGTSRTDVGLLFRPRSPSDDHSVCNWASELCMAFRRDYEMPWIMANVMMLSRFMRWLLIPTEESYNLIPPLMRPTQNQRFIPHNPAADILPIPAIRDALCIRFRDCVTPLTNNCFFNWPHSLDDAIERDPETDSYILTKEFEDRVYDADNWTISRRILEAFPEIATQSDVRFMD